MIDSREFHAFHSYDVREEGDNGRTFTGIVSAFNVEIDVPAFTEMVHPGAFTKTIQEGGQRVRHLWQHDFRAPPIAAIRKLQEVRRADLPADLLKRFPSADGGLAVTRTYLDTPRGNEMVAALNSDPPAITEMSIGFDPVKFDFEENEETGQLIRHLREVRLWDTSDVNWGANPATAAQRSAIAYHDTGKAREDCEWQTPELSDFTADPWDGLTEAEKQRIAAHFAYSENMPPQSFEDLQLPHHAPSRDGIGPVVWQGVQMAMGTIAGKHGGISIPSNGRRAVYRHLSRHYAQFEKEAPDFRTLNLILESRDILERDKWQSLLELLQAEPGKRPLTPTFNSEVERQLAHMKLLNLKGV